MNTRVFLIVTSLGLLSLGAPSIACAAEKELFHEEVLPDEAELTQKSIQLMRQMVETNRDGELRMRAFHAKSHGCIRGRFVPDKERVKKTRLGVFESNAGYPVWARFSNSSGAIQPDGAADVRGLSLKFIGVSGEHLMPSGSSSNNQDFILFSSPSIPTKDAREYIDSLLVLTQKKSALHFAFEHPGVPIPAAIGSMHGGLVTDPAEAQYWSAAPYKFGARAIKY